MLTYDEALTRVLDAADPLPAEPVPLADAYGRALAEPVVAAENLPPFDNSAVDGYAVRLDDTLFPNKSGATVLSVRGGTVQFAGEPPGEPITPSSRIAVPIMTGGTLPPGADAIIMIEDTGRGDNNDLYLNAPASPKFIRRAGSDVRAGETVLNASDNVDAGVIGLLASLGVGRVACHALPRVGILTTGNELVPASTRNLPPAKIRNSNGPALEAAVRAAGGIVEACLHAPDDREALRTALLSLAGCDVVITSGGVSVGDADYVKGVVEKIGTLDFWRVAIRPGKPLAFGRVGDALFFGLPGNPASSLVTFELFVRPVLRRLAGHRETARPIITATLADPLAHEAGRREFVRARIVYRDGEAFATPTGAQGSHRAASMVGANCLLVASEERGDYAAGERLPALLLV